MSAGFSANVSVFGIAFLISGVVSLLGVYLGWKLARRLE